MAKPDHQTFSTSAPKGSQEQTWHYQPLIMTLALGVVITFAVFSTVYQKEQERRQSEFTELAGSHTRAIQSSVIGCVGVLEYLRDLYAASESVEGEEFHIFLGRSLDRLPPRVGLEWLPRVHHARREEFERAIDRVTRGRFQIRAPDVQGRPVPAAVTNEYFPAIFHEPRWEGRAFVGLDHYSQPERRHAMDLARDSDGPAATVWMRLAQPATEEAGTLGVLIYLPVYTNGLPNATREQRRQNLAGFIVASVPIAALVGKALPDDFREMVGLMVIEQRIAAQSLLFLDFSRREPASGFIDPNLGKEHGAKEVFWEGAVDLAGQTWLVRCTPTRRFLADQRTTVPWVVLSIGLLFTGFIVNYQRIILQRAATVERLVAQRTSELKTEIGQRARVEGELARERDLFHTLLDNLPDRIYFKDLKSRFLRVNRAMVNLFGAKGPQDVLGKSDFDFFTTSHAEPAFLDEQRIIETGQPLVGRVELETLPDGKACWAHTTKMPLRDKQGNIVGTFGISRDISELKRMEEKLAEERNLMSNLIEHLPDYIYVKDAQGRFLISNPAFVRLVGKAKPEELSGKTALDIYSEAVAQARHQDDLAIMEKGEPIVNREEPAVDPAGKHVWFLTTKVPLHDARDRIVGLVCVGRDITSRREMEEELKRTNADLQKSHQELKNAQLQLIQAEKMQSVGRLAAGVAHEVKNPLAILGMGIDYLSSTVHKSDAEALMIVEDMRAAIRRADNIVLGLLDFSAPRDVQLVKQDVNRIIEHSLVLTKHEQIGTLVTVERNLTEGLPAVNVDTNKLMQVFVNLFMNACQAMHRGGTLSIRSFQRTLQPSEVQTEAGSRQAARFRAGELIVVVQVNDTGPGIPEDKLGRVFDPFFTTKPTGQGTGLGLTVTQKIIELHGGHIAIRNRAEGGLQVEIWFKTGE